MLIGLSALGCGSTSRYSGGGYRPGRQEEVPCGVVVHTTQITKQAKVAVEAYFGVARQIRAAPATGYVYIYNSQGAPRVLYMGLV